MLEPPNLVPPPSPHSPGPRTRAPENVTHSQPGAGNDTFALPPLGRHSPVGGGQKKARTEAAPQDETDANREFLFGPGFPSLPLEINEHIASFVTDPVSIASLAIAHPAFFLHCKKQNIFPNDPRMPCAFHVAGGGTVDVSLIRRFVARNQVTTAHCEWLNAVIAAMPNPAMSLKVRVQQEAARESWFLEIRISGYGMISVLLRTVYPGVRVAHYTGNKGQERKVRIVSPSGSVAHYTGNKGQERAVRIVSPSGSVAHYTGNKGQERKVRVVRPNGSVEHYTGNKGEERLVWTLSMVF